jgi:hypothetical protein
MRWSTNRTAWSFQTGVAAENGADRECPVPHSQLQPHWGRPSGTLKWNTFYRANRVTSGIWVGGIGTV